MSGEERALETPVWLSLQSVPLDHNGPVDIPRTPLPPDWIEQPVFDLFKRVARCQPDHTAAIDPDARLTYGQILAGATALAQRINATVPDHGGVGILLANSVRYPIAVLGCLAARRPCVLLDRHYPTRRNTVIMTDARLVGVITEAGAEITEPSTAGIVCIPLDADSETEPRQPSELPPDDPDRPAFIIYTSGSTGRPKGLVQSQRTILRRVGQLIDSKHLNATDRFLSLASPCTIDGLFDSLATLLSGATLLKIDLRQRSLRDALRLAQDERATILLGLPTILRALAELPEARAALATLRVVRTSGDALLPADAELIRSQLPVGCHFLSVYGATEAGAMLQWYINSEAAREGARMPAGYPLPGYRLAIIDEEGRSLPPGEIGELVASSRYTALGEWQEGGCVPGRLRPDPTDPSSRILYTGDLALLRADGLFVLLGRRDRQIKINGQRIEPAEVETVLKRSATVREVAVIADRNGPQPVLLAFVGATTLNGEDLTAQLRGYSVPPYPASHPARIHLVPAMPLLPGGKLDQAALLDYDVAARAGAHAEAHAGAMATKASERSLRVVRRAWRRVLGRRGLGTDTPFEEAGGDSLKLLTLHFELEREEKRELPLERFHGRQRPTDLAAVLDELLSDEDSPADTRPIVSLIPGLGGDEPRLAHFRVGCSQALRFHVIKLPGWQALARPGFGWEALVTAVADQIPSGPVLLAGYSFGAQVAVATADLLRRQGRDVDYAPPLPDPARQLL
jgi:amino acid adenylation domain-containing protein